MINWTVVAPAITALLAAIFAIIFVPAGKRFEETNARIAKLEADRASDLKKINKLLRGEAKMRAVIAILIHRDGFLVEKLRHHEPETVIESTQDLLKRLNISMHHILDDDEEEEEGSEEAGS